MATQRFQERGEGVIEAVIACLVHSGLLICLRRFAALLFQDFRSGTLAALGDSRHVLGRLE